MQNQEPSSDLPRPPSQRVESKLNAELAQVIPVVYGALLSYAMYVLAQLITEVARYEEASGNGKKVGLSLTDFIPHAVLFFAFVFFLVEDLGEIIKLAKEFPFKRTSRYSHELIVCFFFLASFAFLAASSSLALVSFAFAVIWGGVWCNQLKEEYRGDESQIDLFAKTQRNLQYFGGALFLAESATFLIMRNSTKLDMHIAVCFGATYIFWLLLYALYPAYRHGEPVNAFLVNTIIPDRLVLRSQAQSYKERAEK
jgi:hypothetical protein